MWLNLPNKPGERTVVFFAIATSVLLCHNFDPMHVNFIQANMCQHLLSCFEERQFTTFPMTLLPYNYQGACPIILIFLFINQFFLVLKNEGAFF